MINQIAAKITRFQLIMLAVWLLIATGLSVAAVTLSFWAERINQARLHAATADVLRTAFESNAQKRSKQVTANAVVVSARRPGVSITIFDLSLIHI